MRKRNGALFIKKSPQLRALSSSLVFDNLDEVLDFENHAADAVVVDLIDSAADFAQAQSLQGLTLVFLASAMIYASFFSDQP